MFLALISSLFLLINPMKPFEYESTMTKLEVKIENLRNTKGSIRIAIFNSADGFPDDEKKIFQNKVVPLNTSNPIISFELPKDGTYALALMHDENDNKKMDKNFLGIPNEGYGFSNNKTGGMSAPSFKECAFTFNNKTSHSISIKLKYW